MSRLDQKKNIYKIIVLGDSGVGKTSLLYRCVKNEFSNMYKATIGADFLSYPVEIKDKNITLQIWDSAGQERYQGLGNTFFRGADAYVLVFDVSKLSSFENINKWRDCFVLQSGVKTPEGFPCILLGNKIDRQDRTVSERMAKEWAMNVKCPFYEVSAKEAIGVTAAFNDLAARLLDSETEEFPMDGIVTSENIKITNDTKKEKCPC